LRQKVLDILKRKQPHYVSGEHMAAALSVSRTAVWKAIQGLQGTGYEIEKRPGLGYRLVQAPDRLHASELADRLRSSIIANPIDKLVHYQSVASTNDTLKELAEAGAPEGTVVLAEEQLRGKGRLGRSWSSPGGKGIWLSALLKPTVFPQETPVFTLIAALAVALALQRVAPQIKAGIKWPNDLLIGERKICGILTELKAEADRLHYLVIGIGVNVNQETADFSPELEPIATSLYRESGSPASRQELAAALINELDDLYRVYRSRGPAPLIGAWKNHSITLGRRVKISQPAGFFSGTAVDIAADGALIMRGEDGTVKHFHAGEVTLGT